jgi:hypothetical protein
VKGAFSGKEVMEWWKKGISTAPFVVDLYLVLA